MALRDDTVERICAFWRLWAEEAESMTVSVVSIGNERFCRAPDHLRELLADPPGELDALVDVLGDELQEVRGYARLAYGDAGSLRLPDAGPIEAIAEDDSRLAALERAAEPFEWLEASVDEPAEHRLGIIENNKLVAVANLREWHGIVGHIGVFTRDQARGRGLAGQVASGVVHIAQERDLVPQWRSRFTNEASGAVADRLGFEAIGTQIFVRVRRNNS